jgi:hypothetical protein
VFSPPPREAHGEGSGVGALSFNPRRAIINKQRPPTPNPFPPLASLAGGGERCRTGVACYLLQLAFMLGPCMTDHLLSAAGTSV